MRLAWGCVWCAAGVLAAGGARAGAFNPEEGRGLAIVTSTFTDASTFRDAAGRRIRGAGCDKFELTAYVEYGLTDRFALIAQPRFSTLRPDSFAAPQRSGLGAADLGVQAQLFRTGGWALSAQGLMSVPGPGRGPRDDRAGGAVARLSLGAGFELAGRPGFAEATAGYRWRAGGATDEASLEAKVGWRIAAPLTLVFAALAKAGRDGAGLRPRTLRVEAGAVWDVAPAWSLALTVFATPHARQAGAERGVSAAVWRRF
ncbi:MAG: hypothetical protein IPL88_09585 [Rhizobiales bacterium]|nr:hypothetical protein [Hyphomicrobiales bacterium]